MLQHNRFNKSGMMSLPHSFVMFQLTLPLKFKT